MTCVVHSCILVKHQSMPVQDMLAKDKVDKLIEYSTFPPKAVNAADLLENQESGEYTESSSYKFLREEVAVRLAHLVMELQHLPKELRLEEKMLFLIQNYSNSFSEVIEFENRDPDQHTLEEFKNLLLDMKKRHKVCSIFTKLNKNIECFLSRILRSIWLRHAMP